MNAEPNKSESRSIIIMGPSRRRRRRRNHDDKTFGDDDECRLLRPSQSSSSRRGRQWWYYGGIFALFILLHPLIRNDGDTYWSIGGSGGGGTAFVDAFSPVSISFSGARIIRRKLLLLLRSYNSRVGGGGDTRTSIRKEEEDTEEDYSSTNHPRPIPAMPSDLFQQLALSQLELLANSLKLDRSSSSSSSSSSTSNKSSSSSKIESMALYLPQENVNSGQLEFLPAIIYPHPSSERVFIASDADSGVAPTLPKLLTKLPGFTTPNSLLPHYPMVGSEGGEQQQQQQQQQVEEVGGGGQVGVVEEVLCDVRSGAPALSVPLFLGSQTVGVLLVSPALPNKNKKNKKNKKKLKKRKKRGAAISSNSDTTTITTTGDTTTTTTTTRTSTIWTTEDREQIARAARTLSMALSMDTERSNLKTQNRQVQNALSDSLHQVKNPLQALRTFGKLLQQRVAEDEHSSNNNNLLSSSSSSVGNRGGVGTTLQLLDLTRNLMVQSDRVVSLLAPIDSLVDSLDEGGEHNKNKNNKAAFYLNPAPDNNSIHPTSSSSSLLVPWDQAHPPNLPWESDTLEFARQEEIVPPTTSRNTKKARTEAAINRRLDDNDDDEDNDSTTIEFSRPQQRNSRRVSSSDRLASSSSDQTIQFTRPRRRRQDTKGNSDWPSSLSSSSQTSAANATATTSIVGDNDDIEMGFIVDVLEPTLSMYRAIAEEQGVSFQILGMELAEELPGVFLRRKSLQEAVSNLLDNAFKYVRLSNHRQQVEEEEESQKERLLLVRVRLMANNDDPASSSTTTTTGVTLIVEDNGPGIPLGETETIFERGFRSSSISDKAPGSGIGLDISRSLVEQMGGTLECLNDDTAENSSFTPSLLKGAVFRIVLFRTRKP